MMLMLWLYGYMNKIHSPRKIETACYNDIGFIWLPGNSHPDYNTISCFFKDHQKNFKIGLTQNLLLTGLMAYITWDGRKQTVLAVPAGLFLILKYHVMA